MPFASTYKYSLIIFVIILLLIRDISSKGSSPNLASILNHSHKKRKDSLESSLDRLLFAAELEILKILVPRLPQHTSNVNTECDGKSKWSKLYIRPASWSTDTS